MVDTCRTGTGTGVGMVYWPREGITRQRAGQLGSAEPTAARRRWSARGFRQQGESPTYCTLAWSDWQAGAESSSARAVHPDTFSAEPHDSPPGHS